MSAARTPGRWIPFQDAVAICQQQGCVVERLPHPLEGPHGVVTVAFLRNPADKTAWVPILEDEEDGTLSPSMVAYWERRLKVTIPWPESS